jgi:Trypsin
VIVGSTKLGELSDGSERLLVIPNTAVTHSDWDPRTLRANLMLFRIQPSARNDAVGLISRDDVPLEQDVTTYGFGRETISGGYVSEDLLRVDLVPPSAVENVLLEESDCLDWIQGADGVTCAYAGAGDALSDACQASAGSPVVDSFGRLVGVTSWDDGCSTARADGEMGTSMAYSSVQLDFGPWLRQTICDLSNSRLYCQGLSDGSLCGLGTTCHQCAKPATYWYSKAMTACGTEPCWPYRTVCGAGTTCNQCCNGYSWKLADFFTSCD